MVEVDARDAESVIEAAHGADVILHALNPPLHGMATARAAVRRHRDRGRASAAGATLMFPGNVYNYGAGMPALLDETTPMHPTSRKGALRVEIENAHARRRQRRRAHHRPARRRLLRRRGDRGSWFDRVITRYAEHGRLTYPGPLEVVHEWAYLPDLVASLVRLAAARDRFEPFDTFGFSGHAVTGRQLIAAIVKLMGRNLKLAGMPWWFLRLAGRVVPTMNEIAEMGYLWEVPHRISGDKLAAAIGDIPHTPFEAAIAAALDELGMLRRK